MKETITSLIICFLAAFSFAQPYDPAPNFGDQGVFRNEIWTGSEQINSHALLPNGKLLLAGFGYWSTPNSFRIKMALIDTICGALDPSFGVDGTLSYTFEQRTKLYDIALQPDGKIVGCGQTAPSNAGSQQRPSVYRLMSDGSPDTSFNATGHHRIEFHPGSSGIHFKTHITADGRITCMGASSTNINGGVPGLGAQRFMPDGSLDTSFAANGISLMPFSGSGYGIQSSYGSGVIQADSMIVTIGLASIGSERYIAMARFDYEGERDTTFGDNGLLFTDVQVSTSSFQDDGIGAAIQDDGRILVSGRSPVAPFGFLMARFLADGSPDPDFGDNGVSVVHLPGNVQAVGYRMQLLPDGTTLQFGTAHWNSGPPAIIKRLADGNPDPDFGSNGVLVVPTAVSNEKFWGGAYLPSGNIMAYGGGAGSIIVAKLTQNPEAGAIVDLGDDLFFCDGESIEVDAGNPGSSFGWSNGDTNQSTEASSSGTLSVLVTTPDGCVGTDTIQVTVYPLPDTPIVTSNDGFTLVTDADDDLQWFLNDVPIDGATGNTLVAEENGTYTVLAEDGNACSSLSDPYAVVVVGTRDYSKDDLIIWPNPATDIIRVDDDRRFTQLEATDMLGRLVPLYQQGPGAISISHLARGTYLLRAKSPEGIFIGRFIKH